MSEYKIGEAAGTVWKILNKQGAMTVAKLQTATKLPADVVNQAVGWLAREGKLVIDDKAMSVKLK